MVDRKWLEAWSPDQARVVLEIRRESFFVEKTRYGTSIEYTIGRCWEGRGELERRDAKWIEQACERSRTSIRMRHVARLERCLARIDRWAA